MIKRAFDIGVASVGLLLTWPLLVMISILIKVDSHGPVIFRQVRVGFQEDSRALPKTSTSALRFPTSLLALFGFQPSAFRISAIYRIPTACGSAPWRLCVESGNHACVPN